MYVYMYVGLFVHPQVRKENKYILYVTQADCVSRGEGEQEWVYLSDTKTDGWTDEQTG